MSQSGIQEKDLNLAISLKTRMLLKLCGIDTVMTRDSDVSLDYGGTGPQFAKTSRVI